MTNGGEENTSAQHEDSHTQEEDETQNAVTVAEAPVQNLKMALGTA